MPKAERPEKDRDGILGPAVERCYGKRGRRNMGGSGVDEDTNQNVYNYKKSRFAKEGLEEIHVSLPLPLEVELYRAISDDSATSSDGSISPNVQGLTLDSSTSVVRAQLPAMLTPRRNTAEIRCLSGRDAVAALFGPVAAFVLPGRTLPMWLPDSLEEVSIRWHPPAATSPSITASVQVAGGGTFGSTSSLWGRPTGYGRMSSGFLMPWCKMGSGPGGRPSAGAAGMRSRRWNRCG